MLTYHNDLNEVTLANFTPVEISVFFAFAKKISETKDNTISFSIDEVKNTAGIKYERLSDVHKSIQKTLKKMQNINLLTGSVENGEFKMSVMFTDVKYSQSEDLLTVKVNPNVTWLLRDVAKNFTEIDLVRLNEIKSTYSKEAYRHLRQYKHTGRWYISLDDFKRLLDVPNSYATKIIVDKIINRHIVKELSPLFPNLTINKIKKGRSIIAFEFRFDTKIQTIDVKSIIKCPFCNVPLVEKTNKETGTTFFAHKYKVENGCHKTFNSIEDIEKAKQQLIQSNNFKSYKIDREHPDDQTIIDLEFKSKIEELINENKSLFSLTSQYGLKQMAVSFFGDDKPATLITFNQDGLDTITNLINKKKATE